MTYAQTNPLSEDFHTFSLIRFAFPSMAMMLFMGVYTITDTIFAARFIDTNALSAINIVCPVLNLIVGMGTMLAAGGSAVVARKMGSKRAGEARSNFTLIILTGALLGLAVSLIGFVFLEEIIRGLGASELLLPYCRDYLRIQLFFAAGNIMQVLYQNLFVTAGKPGLGLVLSVFAGIANIVFDYIFIVLLQMGIRGASLGTSIGYMIPTLAGTIFFFTGKSDLHFCRPKMDLAVLGKSCSNGASEMVSQLSSAVTTFLFNGAMMGLMKEDGVAAITVIIYSQFLLTTLFIGFSMGTAPVISYNYGRQNEKRLKKWFASVSALSGRSHCWFSCFPFSQAGTSPGSFREQTPMFMSLRKMGSQSFHSAFCSPDAISLPPPCLRRCQTERSPRPYPFSGRLD